MYLFYIQLTESMDKYRDLERRLALAQQEWDERFAAGQDQHHSEMDQLQYVS